MRKGIKVAVVAALIASCMVVSVGADTPSVGVEYLITNKGTGLHAQVHSYEGSTSNSNSGSASLNWQSVNQTEVNGSYIVYGSHTCSQYGQYFDVYTSLEF